MAIPVMFIYYPSIQVMLLVFTNSLYMIFFVDVMPYDTKSQNILEVSNIILQMMLGYHMFVFSDFVSDYETRFELGTSFLILLSCMIAVNAGLLMYSIFRTLIMKIRGKVIVK